MWRTRALDIRVPASVEMTSETFRSRVTPTFGTHGTAIATKETIEELRQRGINLQGKIRHSRIDVCCIVPGDAGRTDLFRPHYVARMSENGDATLVVGKIRVLWHLKFIVGIFAFVSTAFVLTGVGTSNYVLCLVGAVPALFIYFFTVTNFRDAVEHWDEIPRDVLAIFGDAGKVEVIRLSG